MKNTNTKKRAALVAAVLVLVFAGSCIWVWLQMHRTDEHGTVCIYLNGKLAEEHPLTADGTYPVYGADGSYNIVEIRDGSVAVTDADCDNQTCVQTGWITSPAYPIVCLPHQLVVQIEERDDQVDGVAR
jgi:hypothetical protein